MGTKDEKIEERGRPPGRSARRQTQKDEAEEDIPDPSTVENVGY